MILTCNYAISLPLLQESETRINQLQIQADAMERENVALKEGFDKVC